MQFNKYLVIALMMMVVCSFSLNATSLNQLKTDILHAGGASGLGVKDFRKSFFQMMIMRLAMPGAKNSTIGCGCAVKNRANDLSDGRWEYTDGTILQGIEISRQVVSAGDLKGRTPLILYGDSRLAFILPALYQDSWGMRYYNAAVGGSTSGDLKRHFDRCSQRAGWNYHFHSDHFYPASPGMVRNVSRDDLGIVSPVQLENTDGFVMSGGNDINLYKPVLKALPFLIPLRINNVVNNLNRVVSYHQAQNAQLHILSQLPLPAGDLRKWHNRDLHKLRGYLQTQMRIFNSYNQINELLPATSKREINIKRAFVGPQHAMEFMIVEELLAGNSEVLWISHILKSMSAMTMKLVAFQRNTGFIDVWHFYQDPSTHYPFAKNNYYYEGGGTPSLNDGIHPSFTGNLVTIHAIRVYANLNNLERDRVEDYRTTGDRCQVLDDRFFPNGQPARWTPEPPPLPEADDDLLGLITLCFIFGDCKL